MESATIRGVTDPTPTSPRSDQHPGLGVSPGIVIGRVMVLDTEHGRVPRRPITAHAVKSELERFDHAIRASIADLHALYAQAKTEMGEETAAIFRVHAVMLADKSLIGPMRTMIEKELVSAEFAVSQQLGVLADKFRSSRDSSFKTKANDIDDLSARVLHHLLGAQQSRLIEAPPDTIIFARDLTPSQTAGFDRSRVIGFATDLGGRTSHTAIVARALGIPAVVGCQDLTAAATEGMTAILDGDRGVVILNPTPEQLTDYRLQIEQTRNFRLSLTELCRLPAITIDGTRIEILGNIEFAEEINQVIDAGGEGVGLYRTEFLYLTSPTEPTEEDHYKAYARCVSLAGGRPLTIRTVDLGADKYTQSRVDVPERNPFLGNRSIRYCLRNLPMFKRQLRALLRASSLGPIKIMFPLVTSLEEFRQAKYHVRDIMDDLAEEGLAFDRDLKMGMMVEVPSAAIMAEAFAREVDFFSIGTNDLVQYTLAVDRTNERVAGLYSHTHPAVLRLIKDVIRKAKRADIPVSCCGESAGDLEFAMLLIGFGLRTLSVTSSSIPQLKRLIRSVNISQCERIARSAIALDSDVQVAALLRERARKIVPEAFDGRTAE